MIQNSISNSQADETARFLWEFENKNPDDPLTWNSKPRAEMQMKELLEQEWLKPIIIRHYGPTDSQKKFMMLL